MHGHSHVLQSQQLQICGPSNCPEPKNLTRKPTCKLVKCCVRHPHTGQYNSKVDYCDNIPFVFDDRQLSRQHRQALRRPARDSQGSVALR